VTGPVSPDSWTFSTNSQSYTISGGAVTFSQAGASGGITNNANAGQTISIANNLGEAVAGSQLHQAGSSTLILTGANTYTGGTTISAGTLQIGNGGTTGSIVGNVLNNGALAFSRSDVLVFDGVISGSGSVTLQNAPFAGFTVLTANNTYTGGTTISSGTLLLGNGAGGGTSGSIVGNVLNNGLFGFNRSNDIVFDGVISGNGGVYKFGAGVLTLTADNTYSDVTVIAAGTLQLGNGGTSGNIGSSTVNNSGTLAFNRSDTLTFSAVISGNGDVVQMGSGTTVLGAANAYFGGTTITAGTLQITSNSSVSSGTVTLNGGLFQTDGTTDITILNSFKINNTLAGGAIDANGVALTLGGNISDGVGAGKLTVLDSAGGGVLVLTGTNTYSGGTTICFCGTLQLGDATHTASMVGDITNEGQFNIVNANTTGITSLINDGGLTTFKNATSAATIAITNKNGGGIEFFDSSSAGNATIVNRSGAVTIFNNSSTAANANITNRSSGVTVFTDNSTAGNATITTLNGGETLFFVAATGGNAQFIANGSGVVDFSGSTGPNGDGRISAGSIAGSGTYVIGAGNTLVVGSNNLSTEVSGVIADSCGCGPGAGSLEKVGSGTLILSGTNGYTGTTTVNGGVLQVDGSIASSSLTTVNAGGALTGVGTVGNSVIASGGIFLAGNGTPGTSTAVSGNLAFQSGALYLVGINSTTSTLVNVTGTATLAGSVGVSVAPGSMVAKQYTILTAAGGRMGTFSGVDVLGATNLIGNLSYDANDVYLSLKLGYGATSPLNVNQSGVANTLVNFFNANGGINAAFANLSPAGLTQASGESATGSQQTTFNAMNLFMGLLTDVFGAGRSGTPGATPYADEASANAYATASTRPSDALASIYRKAPPLTFEQRWDVWAAGFGGSETTDGRTALGSNNTTSSVYGTAVGLDYRFSPTTVAGFALAGGGTGFGVNGLGWGHSDLFQAGAFVRHNVGPAYVTAALAYGWQDVTTNRIVTAAGTDQLRAQFNANAVSGRIEGGYRQTTPWIGLTPYAALQATMFSLPSYSEFAVVGNNTFALNYAAKDVTSTRTELGLRADRSFAAAGGVVTLRGRAAWAHDFNPDRTVGAVFQTLPGSAFVVNGAALARDSALTTASVQMNWMNGWSASATFEGEFSNVTRSYAGKGVVRYSW
jgi:autotransporter-associated beta strand protein